MATSISFEDIMSQTWHQPNDEDKPYKTVKGNFYRTQVYLGSDLWVLVSLSNLLDVWLDLTDVTLANEDMQVMQVMLVIQVIQVIESIQRR